MLRRSLVLGGVGHKHGLNQPPNFERVVRRRQQLEQRRQSDSAWFLPPVEPTPQQAIALYRQLLKKADAQLKLTDKGYFRKQLRYEFEEVARQTSGRVRGIMFEKGKWMAKNDLGGLL